jgi:hypothetical protein
LSHVCKIADFWVRPAGVVWEGGSSHERDMGVSDSVLANNA